MATAGSQCDNTNQINIYIITIIEHEKRACRFFRILFMNVLEMGNISSFGVLSIFIASDNIKHELLIGSPHIQHISLNNQCRVRETHVLSNQAR